MAKNRKHQSAAIRFGPALKAFLLCVLIGGSGVGYVWQKSQIDELGRQITQREKRLRELDDQNKKLRGQLAELRSPGQLNDKVQKLNLGLEPAPTESDVHVDRAGDGADGIRKRGGTPGQGPGEAGPGDALIFRRCPRRGREEPTAAGGGRSFRKTKRGWDPRFRAETFYHRP